VNELLVDARLHPPCARIALGVAAGDDVLADLRLELRGGLLVEVHDRRDVAGHVGYEQFSDLHGWAHG
jgi:hypothetical protein